MSHSRVPNNADLSSILCGEMQGLGKQIMSVVSVHWEGRGLREWGGCSDRGLVNNT